VVSFGTAWPASVSSCKQFQINAGWVNPASVNTMTAFQTGLTQEVAIADIVPVVGDNSHSFLTPLTWNGTDNLIIETTFSNAVTGTTGWTVFQKNTNTSYQSTIVYRVDGVAAPTVATTTTVTFSYSALPDFTLIGASGTPLTYNWSPATGLSATTGATVTATPASTQTYTVTTTSG